MGGSSIRRQPPTVAELSSTFACQDEQGVNIPAAAMRIATGTPSEIALAISGTSMYVTAWSMSGNTAGQSLTATVQGLPPTCVAVKVQVVAAPNASDGSGLRHVWRVHGIQPASDDTMGSSEQWFNRTVVHDALPAGKVLTQEIEAWLPVDPSRPLFLRLVREPGDTLDTWTGSAAVTVLRITPQFAPTAPVTVAEPDWYHAWPMIQSVGSDLVCAYSSGNSHTISDDARVVRVVESVDGGATWSAPLTIADTAGQGEVAVGKGLDSQGRVLLWVRRVDSATGAVYSHHVYRRAAIGDWSIISSPTFATEPGQISDIFTVPTVGLMAFYFAGPYAAGTTHSWGIVTSADDGVTWSQTAKETALALGDWPTEMSGAYVGDGKIIALGRCEDTAPTDTTNAQFALRSDNYGSTWTRARTNICDVWKSTPSLVYDATASTVTAYYYRRIWGTLRAREAVLADVLDAPLAWPDPTVVATGSLVENDAGNANATLTTSGPVVAWYSGEAPNTGIYVRPL